MIPFAHVTGTARTVLLVMNCFQVVIGVGFLMALLPKRWRDGAIGWGAFAFTVWGGLGLVALGALGVRAIT